MSQTKKNNDWEAARKALMKRLDDRMAQASSYPNIRHAIEDTKSRLQDGKTIKKWGNILVGVAFACFFFPPIMPVFFAVGLGALLLIQRKKSNKIARLAFFGPINDATEDKLDALFHSTTSHTNTQHQDFEIFPSSENPWIK